MATLKVTMTGGGPWGFRIFGGDDEPLIIAKIRKRSRAAEAGLHEGDVLLGVNGYSCKGLNHPTVMTLVEQASSELTFDILRGASDQASVEQAFVTLGSQLQTLPVEQHQIHAPPPAPTQLTTSYHTNTTTDGNNHNHTEITTKTTTQQFGDSTVLTKVQREVFQSGRGPALSPYPNQEQRGVSPHSMFTVQQATVAPKPGVWQPSGAQHKPIVKSFKVEAPSGVNVEHNPDQSVTMTFGLGAEPAGRHQPSSWSNQENVAPAEVPQQHRPPPPQFKVRKVAPSAEPTSQAWQPAPAPLAPRQPEPAQEHYDSAAHAQAHYDHQPAYSYGMEESYSHQPMPRDVRDGSSEMMTEDDYEIMKKVMYHRVVMEGGSGSESGADSPTAWFRSKRKIYADSAFYDDPEHKYPTIEEQIKMARKVALSLESPANQRARGHKMFIKRKMKADHWTTEFAGQTMPKPGTMMPADEELEEKYYNPNPWKPVHTWSPPSRSLSPVKPPSHVAPPAPKPIPQAPAPPPPFIPPPPPALPPSWGAPPAALSPKYPPPKQPSEEKKPLSAGEFERLRLHGQKSHHNTMPPSVAFTLAEDLRQNKGKGGRMFAKRQARSEKWVVGEGEHGIPNLNVMNKILTQSAMESTDPGRPGFTGHRRSPSAPAAGTDHVDSQPPVMGGGGGGGMPVNRLKAMIEPPKPVCSPWDAAANEGRLDKAFVHLDGYLKQGSYKQNLISKNLEKAAERSYMTPYKPKAAGIPVNASASDAYLPPTKLWQRQPDFSELDGGYKNPTPSAVPPPAPMSRNIADSNKSKPFRPINFKAPTGEGASKAGVFDAGPVLWKKAGGEPPVERFEDGISDL